MRSVTLLSYWLISVLFVACSSENPQPAQEEKKPMAQQSEQAPAESEPEEQPAASQPAGTAPETAASTEKMAEIKAKPAESRETMAAQEESASQVEQMKSYPQLSMGPNMARVSASIVDVEETGNSYICTLKIKQILGSGPSTPSLVRGNEIKVWIKKVVGQSEKLAEKGGNIEITLEHTPPLVSIQPPPPAWNVMEVHLGNRRIDEATKLRSYEKDSERKRSGAYSNNASKRRSLLSMTHSGINHQITIF